MSQAQADIGVFGGSGFYRFLDDVTEVEVDTPYGPPSAPLYIGTVGARNVAFLARHGLDHEFPPHRINYRANLWAMRELGVTRVLGPCASGSLQRHIQPGDFVIADQLVDRTTGRRDTYFDGPDTNHISFADPYCPQLREVAIAAAAAEDVTAHANGTVVCVQGPRFSTRAESRWYRSAGWEVINMTQYPEAYLARELGLCYATIALITDYDTGVDDNDEIEPVTFENVMAILNENVDKVRQVLFRVIDELPAERTCGCASADNGIAVTPPAAD